MSSGSKIFLNQGFEDLLLLFHIATLKGVYMRLNGVIPDIPFVPGLQEAEKAGHCCV